MWNSTAGGSKSFYMKIAFISDILEFEVTPQRGICRKNWINVLILQDFSQKIEKKTPLLKTR